MNLFKQKKTQTVLKNESDKRKVVQKRKVSLQILSERISKYMSEQYSGEMRKDSAIQLLPDGNLTYIIDEGFMNSIEFYIREHNYYVEGYSLSKLKQRLYDEIRGYSFLTPFLFSAEKNVEEINVDSWDSIKVNFNDGTTSILDEHFFDKEHLLAVFRKMLKETKEDTWDEANPSVTGSIGKSIRLTVFGFGIVDSDVGCTGSIRLVDPNNMQREDFIKKGTVTEEEMQLLENEIFNNTSVVFAGETGSGKTTLMYYFLKKLAYNYQKNHKRITTIEDGMREMNLVQRDENGKIINSVTSFKTTKFFSMKDAVKKAVTNDPDIISIGEMKDDEVAETVEVAITGHQIISTTHADDALTGWKRIVELLRRSYPSLPKQELFHMAASAFPIMIYLRKVTIDGKKRRVVAQVYKIEFEENKNDFMSEKYTIKKLIDHPEYMALEK